MQKLLLIILSCLYFITSMSVFEPFDLDYGYEHSNEIWENLALRARKKVYSAVRKFHIGDNKSKANEILNRFRLYKNKELKLSQTERISLFSSMLELASNVFFTYGSNISKESANLLEISEETSDVFSKGFDINHKDSINRTDLDPVFQFSNKKEQKRIFWGIIRNSPTLSRQLFYAGYILDAIDHNLISTDHNFLFNLAQATVFNQSSRIAEAQTLNQLDEEDLQALENIKELKAKLTHVEFPQRAAVLLVRGTIDNEWTQ